MWSSPLIIGVAVAGAFALLVTGIVLAIKIERRRHRYLVQASGHGRARSLSTYHKAQLSANENNYLHVPQPIASPRNSPQLRSGRLSAWEVNSSQERLRPHPVVDDIQSEVEILDRPPKRRRSLRQTIYDHSIHIPKTRRQKKIQKAISLRLVPRSPLSAITEFTDSSSIKSPLDSRVPSDVYKDRNSSISNPKSVVHHASNDWPVVGERSNSGGFNPGCKNNSVATDDLIKKKSIEGPTARGSQDLIGRRSTSLTSTASIAPNDPLPPVPAADAITLRPHHGEPRWRYSVASIDTVDSSVLGSSMTSPRWDTGGAAIKSNVNSGIQSFDFGLVRNRASAIFNPPPGKQTLHSFCSGCPGITSTHPSFEFDKSKNATQVQATEQAFNGLPQLGSFKTIDASCWDLSDSGRRNISGSLGKRTRHSMYEGNNPVERRSSTYLRKPSSLVDSKRLSHHLPQRPSSVAGTALVNTENHLSMNNNRASLGFYDNPRKGHRRQNCVRITNLPTIERQKVNRLGHVPELSEEITQEMSSLSTPKKPVLNTARNDDSRLSQYLVNTRELPSPVGNRSSLGPLTRSPGHLHLRSDENIGSPSIPRSDSDVFGPSRDERRAPSIFITPSPRHWPMPPSTPDHTKVASCIFENVRSPFDSPILPTPVLTSDMLFPRKSQVKGPRQLPFSGRSPRLAYPSPTRRHTSTKARVPNADLRRSVMMFRSMNSEGHLLDSNSRFYRNLGGDSPKTQGSSSPSRQSSPLAATSGNMPKTHVNFGDEKALLNMSKDNKTVAVSPSTMFLGATSVWEDASVRGDSPEPEMPAVRIPEHLNQHQPQTPKKVSWRHDLEACENNTEHNTSPNHWTRKSVFMSSRDVGLGVHVGNSLLGTPGSLYDNFGFLKE